MSKDMVEEESYEDAFNAVVDGEDDESGEFETESTVDESEEPEAPDDEEGEQEDEHSEDPTDSGIAQSQETPRDDKGRFKSKDEELAELREEAQKWQHRYNSDLGRQNALQRKIQEQEQQLSQLRKAPQQEQSPAGMSPAEWETLKEDFPEIAAAMESRLSVINQQYESKISRLEQQIQPMQQQAQQQYKNAQYQILESQHPDWKTVAQTPEFRQWIDAQPSAVVQLMESDEAADAAYLIGTYKLHTQPTSSIQSDDLKQRREKQLRQGQTLSNRGGRKKSAMPAEDDYENSFNFFAEQ